MHRTDVLRAAPLLLALTLTPTLGSSAARATAGDIEISFTSEALTLVSDSVAATTDNRVNWTPGLRLGVSPVDRLTIIAGWRDFVGFERGDRGYTLDSDSNAFVLGARSSLGLHPVVDLHGEVDLEALHTDFELEIAGQRGSTSAWAFGVIPKAVASVLVDLDFLRIDIRVFVGFALRTNLAASGLRLDSRAPADQVAPVDLGSVNLSGLVFGTNIAVVF
jgi:hypothetical protein